MVDKLGFHMMSEDSVAPAALGRTYTVKSCHEWRESQLSLVFLFQH